MFPQPSQIQINQLPTQDRLTMPVGTFLSNPSTAASGFLGGAQPSNIPQIGTQVPGGQMYGPPKPSSGFGDWLKNLFAPSWQRNNQGAYVPGAVIPGASVTPNMQTQANPGSPYNYNVQSQPTGALSPVTPAPSAASSNSLVGVDLSTSPQQVSIEMMSSIFPGRSQQEIQQLMASKGYSLVPGNKPGQTGMFVLTGESAPAEQQRTASGALLGPTAPGSTRPEWVDPTTLARNERIQTANGTTYVGGAVTTKDIGNTPAGTSQYAVTVAQNINKKLEAQGAYKWKSYTQKDQNGNWVKVYRKELRKVYSKQHQRKQEARREEAAPQTQTQVSQDGQNFTQLVNMRLSYG